MKEKETKPLSCPFCGAPQRKIIPQGSVQLKCEYCGGIILVPPWMGGETYQCRNHPERLANGICNDCGGSFCGDCLNVYTLNTESARAVLYLCFNCLRKRYVEKAKENIYVGIILLLLGIFSALVLLPLGIPIVLMGVGIIVYGFSRKTKVPEGLTINRLRLEEEKRKAERATFEGIDVEETYNKLLTHYVTKWGAQMGIEFLENEIRAYTRHGVSFQEAVKKIYKRQEKGLREK